MSDTALAAFPHHCAQPACCSADLKNGLQISPMFSSGSDKPLALPFVELHIFRVRVKTCRSAELGIKHQDCCGYEGLKREAAVSDIADVGECCMCGICWET